MLLCTLTDPTVTEGRCEQVSPFALSVHAPAHLFVNECVGTYSPLSEALKHLLFNNTPHSECTLSCICSCVPAGLPAPPELTLYPDPAYHAFKYCKCVNAFAILLYISTVLQIRELFHLQHHRLLEVFKLFLALPGDVSILISPNISCNSPSLRYIINKSLRNQEG